MFDEGKYKNIKIKFYKIENISKTYTYFSIKVTKLSFV